MMKTLVGALAGLLALPAITFAQIPQNPPPVQAGAPPNYASTSRKPILTWF